MAKSNQAELANLLTSLFSGPELQRFVRYHPEYEALEPEIAWSNPPIAVASELVSTLDRRGLLDDRFAGALVKERPRRAQEIERVALAGVQRPVGAPPLVCVVASAGAETAASLLFSAFARRGVPVVAGERSKEALHRATHIVFVWAGQAGEQNGAFDEALAIAYSRAFATEGPPEVRIVPVYLTQDTGFTPPQGLLSFQPFILSDKPVDLLVSQLFPDASPTPHHPTAAPAALESLARQFLVAAGRQVELDPDHYLFAPEPVLIAQGTPLSSELMAFGHHFIDHGRGLLVHDTTLPGEVVDAILTLRAKGFAFVTLAEWVLRAALADGNAVQLLERLIREQVGTTNHFKAGNATLERRYLFGRGPLLATVGRALYDGEHILLTGTRKSGKTSFLNILRQDLTDRPVAFVDLQAIDLRRADWPDVVFGEVVDAYDRWGAATYKDWPTPPTGKPVADLAAAMAVRQQQHQARGVLHRMIVAFDELERVFPRGDADPSAWIRLTGALRAMSQGGERSISLIAADLRPVANRENALGDQTNPFFQFFQETPMPPLEPAAVEELLRSLGLRMGITKIQPELVARVVELGGGHTWVTRTLAAAAADVRASPTALSLDDLDRGLDDLFERDELGNFFRQNFWAPLTEGERAVLRAVCSGAAPPTDSAARASLRSQQLVIQGKVPIGAFAQWVVEQHSAARAAK